MGKRKIIIINGSGGVGKDTFVDFCREFTRVKNISTVTRIKEIATILGWDGGKTEKDRLFLSNLKLLSTEYNNGPFEYIKEMIIEFMTEDIEKDKIMFIHVREPEEIEKCKDSFVCETLLIKNTNVLGITSNMADANVENYKYDYTIDNSEDLSNLKCKAKHFVEYLLK